MAFQLIYTSAVTALLIISTVFIRRYLRTLQTPQAATQHIDLGLTSSSSEPSKSLAAALPDSIILPHNAAAFEKSMNSYWAQQECEVIPACIVRPRNVEELCVAVTILKREYDERGKQACEGKSEALFAIRSGGHSPIAGVASIKGGVLIDLGLLCDVTPSEDRSSVAIGAGAKWMDVSKVLDAKGLAVTGGRNSAVGVGGLTLGGGLSFFSPRFGLVCSNIISYEIVLASGSLTTASASTNPDLWRALKGGSNNFGIVTRFTARSFPSTKIWSGFLYMPAFQATKVLAAFHEYLNRADSGDPSNTYDNHSAGPIACFTYVHKIGIQAISVNLVYTKSLENEETWPLCWRTSSFKSLFRVWSTCKNRTLTNATDELNALNSPGRRQAFATTTIKNDPATLAAAHTAYSDAIASIRSVKIKDLVYTLVLQPFLPDWVRKGDTNSLGLHNCGDEPLVIVSLTVNWADSRDDEFVKTITRRTIEEIDVVAAINKTSHPYRYLNYCADWQKPFESYGEDNRHFLQEVSRRYDPERLFQRGCVGAFKLDAGDRDA